MAWSGAAWPGAAGHGMGASTFDRGCSLVHTRQMSQQPARYSGGLDDIRQAWMILAGGAPAVAQSLVDISVHGKSEIARVQASVAVLSRVGLPERVDVGVRVLPDFGEDEELASVSAAELVRSRLEALHVARHLHVVGGELAEAPEHETDH